MIEKLPKVSLKTLSVMFPVSIAFLVWNLNCVFFLVFILVAALRFLVLFNLGNDGIKES